MGWSKKYKKSIDCNNPKGFSQKAHCAGRKKQESKMSLKLEELVGKRLTEEQFDEAAGKKDACYHKVKARYDVWPSAYASGALVKCRKVGAKNWGNKSKKEGLGEVSDVQKRKIYKKAFGKEYDDSKRKQTPLPLDIAYKVALNKLKKKEGVYEKNKGKTLYGKDLVNYFVKRFKYSTRDATAVANKLKDVGFKVPKVLPFNESVNEGDTESRELKLYIDNDGQLYNSRFMPIIKNLSKKMKKGNYDKKLAIKGFMYLVDAGAKKYVKDFGGNARDMFSKKDRIAVASDLADEFEEIYKNKEYSFMEGFASDAQRKAAFASGYKAKGKKKKKNEIEEGRVLHFTQIKDKTLEKHLKVIAKKVGATVSKISGGFKVDADNDGRKLAQVVDYIFDKSLMKGLMSGGGMSRVQLVNEKKLVGRPMVKKAIQIAKKMKGNMTGAVKKIEKMMPGLSKQIEVEDALRQANEGLGDMVGKSIGKYNKKRKKNMDALKKLKKKESVEEARGTCWVGYQQVGMKKKGDRMVPNCVKETIEIFYEENGEGHGYTLEHIKDLSLNEAEYQGRKVKLGKIMQGDTKKFKVYVKNPKGNVVKVNFGQGGSSASKTGGTMRIRKSNPKARANFRARHNCDNPGPRHKARYWSCRKW